MHGGNLKLIGAGLCWCNFNGFVKWEVRSVAKWSDLAIFTGETVLRLTPLQAYQKETVAETALA